MDRLVDVYPYRRRQSQIEVLLLKRSTDVIYTGQWRMVGGKVGKDEKAYNAGLRELDEETTLHPKLFWVLPSVNQFYDPKVDSIRQIPAFAAEVQPEASIVLNHEHSAYKWVPQDEVSTYIHWPEQRRLINLLISIVTHNQLIDEWILEL
ncbi:NUDIX domain-containing protein [Fodinibius salsisoli]|uniref:NUDIX domain-containing protein n=1 Tax=Fodinibius salsisoli TaxID=2820877 RepID=A0ABT3PK71_9BACT|nr:NUDIX domain-containing protein [Fodinibius salsisoli]MCW9706331.1 NUDIX domain-containing protein [Fodinibius salsisoli]